ncbi:MAG: hypothetical protein L6R45_13880 [Anaerolineae bacterium]|nr:hypothetical protein [Anaerolineae bacterium]
MEISVENNLAQSTPPKKTTAKMWLWLLPVLTICTLSFCGVAGGLVFWQTHSQQTEEIMPVSDLSLQNQPETNLTEPEVTSMAESFAPDLTPVVPTAEAASTSLREELPVFACPPDQLLASQSITAPVFSPVSFATRQGNDGWPLDTALQFTTTVTKVLATFSYIGLENGLPWERVWYFGHQELSRGSGVWDAGPQGHLTVQVAAGEGGFAPGVYKLEIYVAGRLMSQGAFNLVKPDTPAQRPVQVAYTTWDGTTHQLHLLDLTTNLTETLISSARGPAWSPDAVGLLFYNEADPAGLQVFNMGQKKAYSLSQEPFFQTAAWSPNRAYVAAAKSTEQGPQLILGDLNHNKSYPGPMGATPAWSPEGQRLAYRGCTDEGWNISTIRVISSTFDFNSIQRLSQGDDSQPAWSWDGQQLAFVRQENHNQDIYVMKADGSNLIRLTDHPAADVSPAWTPAGRLLFRSLRDGQWGLYGMNSDGSNQRLLITTPAQTDWQPDPLAVSTDVLIVTPDPPKPQPQIPAGYGLLAISNQKNNDEMTFTIDNKEHKIGPYQVWMLPLKPGHYTWTASWPGKSSRTGIADITLGQVSNPVVER